MRSSKNCALCLAVVAIATRAIAGDAGDDTYARASSEPIRAVAAPAVGYAGRDVEFGVGSAGHGARGIRGLSARAGHSRSVE
mmetsp:Transcript_29320/g.90724  ORF Transcript_29320/g.90724 Transcript_29320/m.90724 type:complete len:82 (+) Transcript_29320:893-1138(+)